MKNLTPTTDFVLHAARCAVFMFGVAVAGCGGGTPPAPGNPAVGQGAVSAESNAAGKPQGQTEKTASERSTENRSNRPVDPASIPPGWDPAGSSATASRFGIMEDHTQGGARFAIDESADHDRFVAVVPERGLDSSRYAIVAGAEGSSSDPARNSGAAQTPTSFQLPNGFEAVPGAGTAADGRPLRIRCRQDDSIMSLVPEGTFVLGVDGRDPNAGPRLSVFLDTYYIDVNEVTVAQYDRYRDVQRQAKKRFAEPARAGDRADEPVTGVSWTEAHAYALWAQKDLPTEAEWEKAARGPEGFSHPWGNGPCVWHRERTARQIDPVGSFRGDHSPYGVNDLAGNAREWCADYYGEKFYAQLAVEGGSTPRNPAGPKSSGGTNQRVVKGGNAEWLVWIRSGIPQSDRPLDVGFRCVLRIKGEKRP